MNLATKESTRKAVQGPIRNRHRPDPLPGAEREARRDRLIDFLDELDRRPKTEPPTPEDLARLAVLASAAFVPGTAAARTFGVLLRAAN